MTDYPYRQGIDYGPRDGTLGLSYHMSEGGDELPSYLGRHQYETAADWRVRVRGVSCHAALLSDGTIWQMLGWDRTCGNLNPDDRSGEYGYYGASYLKAVLGTHWWDPNEWTISMEIAGYRAVGPTQAQVQSAIRWGLEMKAKFPSLRGAIGHHDQSPKGCPGLTAAMKTIFVGVGGHGLWSTSGGANIPVEEISDVLKLYSRTPQVYHIPAGVQLLDPSFTKLTLTSIAQDGISPFGVLSPSGGHYRVIPVVTGGIDQAALVHDVPADVTLSDVPVPTVDCSAIQKELDAANGNLAACQADLINIKAAGFEAGRAKGIELLEGMTL